MKELPKIYEPQKHEDSIYQKWEESEFFNPDKLPGERKESFSISLPLPNVTGKLHIGHAAMLAYQDLMIRYHRLKGDKTLWLPGMDHAAIATQNVVEKELNKEGKSRHDLGREIFLERVNIFAEEAKVVIRNQLKKMGSSLDWSREKFTLDDDLSKTVRYVFKKMYDDGLIYRGNRVVNWCPKCRSTLADDEVEHEEAEGKLYFIKYGPLTIATTRPETKLGDTGLAVNPKDKRYKDLVGQELDIDLACSPKFKEFRQAGHKIKVKVFADREVDMEFGTGAIGVTPAHSQQDFFWAEKYDLPIIKVIDEQGKMTDKAGKYHGLTTLECREQLVKDLEIAGQLEKIEDYTNNLSVCYRCNTAIEPLTSKQWFVDVNKKIPGRHKSLKQLASEIVKKGDIKIIPERFTKTYFQWMDNLRDWCISRQIWYGHRIPVWYRGSQSEKEMSFYCDVVPQVFAGKTKTYRLKNKGFKIGDEVVFKDSQMNNIIGTGKIIKVTKTTVGKIPLDDTKHGTTYKKQEDLIAAFKRHYPEIKVTKDTVAYIYEYRFNPKAIPEKNRIKTEIIYFVHGTTTDNEKGLASGWTPVSLSELGKKQSLELKEKVKDQKFDLVFCSDLKRAVDSAKTVFGDKYEIIQDERLRECNYGDLTQKSEKDFPQTENYYIEHSFPQGESFRDVGKRMSEFLLEVTQKYSGKRIAIMAHKYPQLALEVLLNGKTWPQAIKEDWRKKKIWQPGWIYNLYNLIEPEEIYVGIEPPQGQGWIQDEDTLDTWFSSSLWTFSTLGWPNKTEDLKTFHPTSVMETGYDILFFWVARMIMMSTYILKERPFDTVYLHGLIRTKSGEKMSKSKPETCIDPLEMIEKFGADALRLSLIVGATAGNDIRLYEEKIAGYRNFVNKLWNISRYVLTSVSEVRSIKTEDPSAALRTSLKLKTLSDQWILSEFNQIIESTTKNIEEFRFSQAGEELYEFTWSKLADWYLEIAKIEGQKDEILLYILERLLILWQPFCPYVTEVLWERFGANELLMVQEWPGGEDPRLRQGFGGQERSKIEDRRSADFQLVQDIVIAIRNTRAEHRANPKKVYSCAIASSKQKIIDENKAIIEGLTKVKITPKSPGLKIHVASADIVLDIKENQEIKKSRNQKIKNLERYIQIQENKLKNKDFVKKAPKEVVEAERKKLEEVKEKLSKLIG